MDAYTGLHLNWTFDISESRYWDSLSVAKAQVTKLAKSGIKAYIVSGSLVLDNIGEEF